MGAHNVSPMLPKLTRNASPRPLDNAPPFPTPNLTEMSSIKALKVKNSKLKIWKSELNSGLITIYHKLNYLRKRGPQVLQCCGQLDRVNHTLLRECGAKACEHGVKGPGLHECDTRIANAETKIIGLHERVTRQVNAKLKGCCIYWAFGVENTSTACLRFVQNPVHAKKLCYPIKFNILDSTEMLKLSTEVVTTKSGFHTQAPF